MIDKTLKLEIKQTYWLKNKLETLLNEFFNNNIDSIKHPNQLNMTKLKGIIEEGSIKQYQVEMEQITHKIHRQLKPRIKKTKLPAFLISHDTSHAKENTTSLTNTNILNSLQVNNNKQNNYSQLINHYNSLHKLDRVENLTNLTIPNNITYQCSKPRRELCPQQQTEYKQRHF